MISVFTVIEKGSTEYDENLGVNCSKYVKVYAVRDDKNGYPQFLVYENGEWKYRSAKILLRNKIEKENKEVCQTN